MSIKPLLDRIVIEEVGVEVEKSPGGIYIPDSAKEPTQKGKIVAIGPGTYSPSAIHIKMEAKVGDVIVHGRGAGMEIEYKGKKYLIMPERDILAFV